MARTYLVFGDISFVPISRSVRHKIRVAVPPPFCARNVC
jgi:hypothetical protein